MQAKEETCEAFTKKEVKQIHFHKCRVMLLFGFVTEVSPTGPHANDLGLVGLSEVIAGVFFKDFGALVPSLCLLQA